MIYKLVYKKTEILPFIATFHIDLLRNLFNHVFALLISMPRLKAITFIKIGLKSSYICKKYKLFLR